MKKLFTVFLKALAVLVVNSALAQPIYHFANGIGSASSEEGRSVIFDGTGSTYVAGRLSGTADFDPSAATATLTPVGNADIFLAKYNNAGQYQWAFNIGGKNADVANGVTYLPSGDVIIVGQFSDTVDFNPAVGVATLAANGLSPDIFVAKYNSSGVYQWAFRMGSPLVDDASSVTCDASGNIYVTGGFQGTVDFDPGAGTQTLTAVGSQDIYVAKYNSSGVYQAAIAMGSTLNDQGKSIAVQSNGNVFVVGQFNSTVDFDPSASTATLVSNGLGDIYLAKYNSSLTYLNAFNVGSSGDDIAYGVCVDNSNSSVFITGSFSTTVDFDPSAGTSTITSAGNTDAFVAGYNCNTNAYQMAFNIGQATAEGGQKIASDGAGNIYVTGYFSGTSTDFDPGNSTYTLATAGSNDVFVARYTSAGAFQFAFALGSAGNDFSWGIDANSSQQFAVTGQYTGTCDFDPSAATANLTSIGNTDIFLAKYASNNLMVAENKSGIDGLTIFPNPASETIFIKVNDQSGLYTIRIIDVTGRICRTTEIDPKTTNAVRIDDLNKGIYFIQISEKSGAVTTKKILFN